MQLLEFENFPTSKKDYIIHIYRNNNNDSIILEPSQQLFDKLITISDLNESVPMNGDWSKTPQEYEGYSEALERVKRSLLIHSSF
jgi:hypothetical protein